MKMETEFSSETLLSTNKSTQSYNPQSQRRQDALPLILFSRYRAGD
jgi:hypothetical protein